MPDPSTTTPKYSADEVAKIFAVAGRGKIDALLERKDEIVGMPLEDVNKLATMLPRVADGFCCGGGIG